MENTKLYDKNTIQNNIKTINKIKKQKNDRLIQFIFYHERGYFFIY